MPLKIFGLNGSAPYAKEVAKYLDIPVAKHIERDFEDGEIYLRSDENVRGCDVYVIHSLYSDSERTAGEKLTTLLFFIGSLKDASAARVTVIAPYLAFSRQDRKTESRAPITTKYLARLLEAAGADRLLTMDVHNLSAFQNAFRIPTDNLEARNLFVDQLVQDGKLAEGMNPEDMVFLSPDEGRLRLIRSFRDATEKRLKICDKIGTAYVDKQRSNSGEVTGDRVIGDVKGKKVIIADDMISSGKTIRTAVDAVENHGGQVYAVCATHGLFIGKANEHLKDIKNLLVTDTIPSFRLNRPVQLISTASLFARAIRRTHEEGGSISELLKG